MLPEINNYLELVRKLDYDLDRYQKNNHIYELMDCLMILNALPEWIKESSEASVSLKALASTKILVMKGKGLTFDENQLDTDVDHQLRFIRLICNHSKHKTDSPLIPVIRSKYGATFPMTLPAKLYNIIAIGDKEIDAEDLINKVTDFWKSEIIK
jgi:hypothetical protein